MPVGHGVRRRSKPGDPFPTPLVAIEQVRAAADVAHHSRIEAEVEAAQQRWLDEQKAG